MSQGDRIIVGVRKGDLIPQPGATFTETDPGEQDTGERVFLTRKDTPRRLWPQRGDKDSEHPYMFARTITDELLECGLIQLTVTFRGSLKDNKPALIKNGCAVQMFSLPALASEGGQRTNIVAPVPLPTVSRRYISREQPTNAGVASGASGDFLPTPPSFFISFIPDPDSPATLNYITGWVLQSREWEETELPIWPVEETFVYYFNIAV